MYIYLIFTVFTVSFLQFLSKKTATSRTIIMNLNPTPTICYFFARTRIIGSKTVRIISKCQIDKFILFKNKQSNKNIRIGKNH